MRIVITSLDGIGDVMLRQPFFAALVEAGHELLIVSRHFTAALVKQMVPGASVVAVAPDPYKMTQGRDARFPEEVLDAINGFYPELLMVAPFQWTIFEDYLAAKLSHVASLALSGFAYEAEVRPPDDPLPAFVPNRRVETPEETPELLKNELLCQAILGRKITLGPPVLRATVDQTRLAQDFLARQGIAPETFWICCVGHSQDYYSQLKSWSRNEWISTLGQVVERHKWPLVFVGSMEDQDSLMWIRDRLSGTDVPMAVAADKWGDLDLLIGLSALARGYIGHDTGPLHVAAALGKPAIAVFGGGGGSRFFPAAEPSRVLTVKVPCVGCGWFCHMEESFCVKKVPVEEVVRAVDDLVAGKISGREVRMMEPSAKVLADMVRRGVAVERKKRYVLREHYQTATQAMRESQSRLAELAAAKNDLAQQESHLNTLHQQHDTLAAREEEEAAELAAAKKTLAQREGHLAKLNEEHSELTAREQQEAAELASAKMTLAQREAHLTKLNEEHGKLAAREEQEAAELASAKMTLAQREAYLAKLHEEHSELAAERERDAAGLCLARTQIGELQGEITMLNQTQRTLEEQVAELTAESEREARRLEQATMRIAQLRREITAITEGGAARELDAEIRQKKLKEQLTVLQAELREAQYARSQLSGALTRSELEHRTMMDGLQQLTQRNHHLQAEMQGLRGQLEQLMRERDEQANHARELSRARSRRLLVKLNLVNRCPWETE